jgi:hypothetical protein
MWLQPIPSLLGHAPIASTSMNIGSSLTQLGIVPNVDGVMML